MYDSESRCCFPQHRVREHTQTSDLNNCPIGCPNCVTMKFHRFPTQCFKGDQVIRTASTSVCVLGIWWFVTIILIFRLTHPSKRRPTCSGSRTYSRPRHSLEFFNLWYVSLILSTYSEWYGPSCLYLHHWWLKIKRWISLSFWRWCQSYLESPRAVGAACSIFTYAGPPRWTWRTLAFTVHW